LRIRGDGGVERREKGEKEEQQQIIPDFNCCCLSSSAFLFSFSFANLFFSFQAANVSGVTLTPTPVNLALYKRSK
jgi:hypothetical protein